jgi:SAM-dependent methyltransferase
MGFMTKALSRRGHTVVAIDTVSECVCAATCGDVACRAPAGVVYRGVDMPFADASFETVICLDVIEHVEKDQVFLSEIMRILQPGGRLLLTVPAVPELLGRRDLALGHYRRYSRRMLVKRLATAGLKLDRAVYWNFLGVVPSYLAEKVARRPLSDNVRLGRKTVARSVAAFLLKVWLLGEWLCGWMVPIGLSIVVVAHSSGSMREQAAPEEWVLW